MKVSLLTCCLAALCSLPASAIAAEKTPEQLRSEDLRSQMPESTWGALDMCEDEHLPDWPAAFDCQADQVNALIELETLIDQIPEEQQVPVFLNCSIEFSPDYIGIAACHRKALEIIRNQ